MVSRRILDSISLKGKTSIVTGGASGICRATALMLAEAGSNMAVIDVDEEGGRRVVEELRRQGVRAEFYRCDVTSSSECERTISNIYRDFGGIDVLVNCAGIIIRKDVVELTEEEWDRVIDVNLKGVFITSHHVIPYMKQGGGGSIVNIASGWGLKGGPKAAAYCAAKAGVINLTRAMAIDHGGDNIRVNCVAPGDVDTPMLRREAAQLGVPWEQFVREAADRPLRRIGRPEDVAMAVLFLASDMSSWITGSVLVVDGGGTA